MDIEIFRSYCLAKKGVTESFPFGVDTLVFKVMGKIFALTSIEIFESINLKCDPDEAVLLREQFSEVLPGYHMNKKHWNTILINGNMDDPQLKLWIDHSYELVVNSLSKKSKQELEEIS